MFERLKNFFILPKSERTETVTLLVLIFFLILIYQYKTSVFPHKSENTTIPVIIKKLQVNSKQSFSNNIKPPLTINAQPTLFRFDPNTLTAVQWIKLGLTEKQANVILRYCSKGGRFRKPEDLQKMYVISPTFYERVKNYIEIKSSVKGQDEKIISRKSEMLKIEINSATAEELTKLRGIGEVFSKRIVKYREMLGGFVQKEQLLEVYKFDTATYLKIKDQVEIDTAKIKKWNINTLSAYELSRHPYIKYTIAKSIVQARNKLGYFHSLEEIKYANFVDDNFLNKTKPYLTLK